MRGFVERVREQPVLPVVGPSGAGKSSFIQAGVIPRLREQGPWQVLCCRPGVAPFRALAAFVHHGEGGGELRLLIGNTSSRETIEQIARREGFGRLLAEGVVEDPAGSALLAVSCLLIGGALLGPIGEELVFRGALLPHLARTFSPWAAIVARVSPRSFATVFAYAAGSRVSAYSLTAAQSTAPAILRPQSQTNTPIRSSLSLSRVAIGTPLFPQTKADATTSASGTTA